jgi:hypothetical protein
MPCPYRKSIRENLCVSAPHFCTIANMTPVIKMFISANGMNTFQPNAMS